MLYKLSKEIIELSEANNWDSAKKEWSFIYGYQQPDSQCLCGKTPIKNVCVLRNKLNDKTAKVGNCCVTRFMDISISDKIFQSIRKLKKDINKSMNADTLEYLHGKKIINDWEYEFYKDTRLKRKPTNKQLTIRVRINETFLAYINDVNEDDNKIEEQIESILKWANDKDYFDTTYITRLKIEYHSNGALSPRKKQSIANIIEKWGVNNMDNRN